MVLKRKKYPRPKRSYVQALDALRRVSKICPISDDEALGIHGQPGCEVWEDPMLRVVVWNLAKGASKSLFVHEFRRLRDQSDVFLTQEALLTETLVELFREPGFQGVHAGAYGRSDGVRDGVMTLARMRFIEGQRILSQGREPIFRTPKSALLTKYSLGSRELAVVNVHSTLVRSVAQAKRELEHIIEKLGDHQGPIVFGGDFNTFSPRYLEGIAHILGHLGLEYVSLTNDPRHALDSLDQIFVRGFTTVKAFVDIHTSGSDHFPIIIHLSLN